jgi:FtsP/CotA-like multicopper oxidase with cupredoxin domain
MVERGSTRRYTFAATPTGTRCYHSHNVARTDLTRSLHGGLYGFLIVEPANDPGRYAQEALLAAHHWEGSWVSLQDIRRGRRPTTASRYGTHRHPSTTRCSATMNPFACAKGSASCSGCSTPVRPKTSRWRSQVALDDNPVPSPQTIDTLFLAPAERADVVVEMNRGRAVDPRRHQGRGPQVGAHRRPQHQLRTSGFKEA